MFSPEDLKQQGNKLAGQKKYSEALEQYNLAIKADPQLAAAWFNKGVMHKRLNQYNDAVIAFDRTLEIKPEYFKAKNNKADIFYQQEKYQEARQLFYEVIKQQPNNIDALKGKLRCDAHVVPNVFFGIVDLKLTKDNEVKILELGEGMRSTFSGLNVATEEDIVALLQKRAQQLSLPPIILNHYPAHNVSPSFTLKDEQIEQLTQAPIAKLPERLVDYRAILASGTLGALPDDVLPIMTPNAVLVIGNKKLTDDRFKNVHQENACPRTLQFRHQYSKSMANHIKQKMPGVTTYLLKLPSVERGEGVMIVEAKYLDDYLKFLLGDADTKTRMVTFMQRYKPNVIAQNPSAIQKVYQKIEFMEAWRGYESPDFLVQDYIKSKKIKFQGVDYDPTMRVAILFVRDGQKLKCEIFSHHWKMPPQSIEAKGDKRGKRISSFTTDRIDSAPVSDGDKAIVSEQLKQILPSVLSDIFAHDVISELEANVENESFPLKDRLTQLSALTKAFIEYGHFALGKHYLDRFEKMAPTDPILDMLKGEYHYYQGQFSEAIPYFIKASKHINEGSSLYSIARCYCELREIANANTYIKKAMDADPSITPFWSTYAMYYQASASAEKQVEMLKEINAGSQVDFSVLAKNQKRMKR